VDKQLQARYLLAATRAVYPRHVEQIALQLGDIAALADAAPEDLRQLKLPGGIKQRLADAIAGCDPAAELARLADAGISTVGYGLPGYPELLAETADAPPLLFIHGDPELVVHHGIAVVGSRKCSERGRQHAYDLGQQLADARVPMVSGMALGIDGAAHEGALDRHGPTVAVLGCGVDVVYPARHQELYERLCEHGAVVSEYLPGTPPHGQHFPQRNRIISGLSKGTIVVEAPMGSGALITARLALEQGRDVFALPGPVGSPYSRGPHHLIKTGKGKLVETLDDVLVEYGTSTALLRAERATAPEPPRPAAAHGAPEPAAPPPAASTEQAGGSEQALLEVLSYEGTHINDIVRKVQLGTAECIATLTLLEIKGLVSSAGNGYYVRL
jgi:DNA processing protein